MHLFPYQNLTVLSLVLMSRISLGEDKVGVLRQVAKQID